MQQKARQGDRVDGAEAFADEGRDTDFRESETTCKNRLIAWALPYYTIVSADEMESGCSIIVADTVRIPPEAVDPSVKNFGRLDFVSALFEAYDRDAHYAVLLDRDGFVTEGRRVTDFVSRLIPRARWSAHWAGTWRKTPEVHTVFCTA